MMHRAIRPAAGAVVLAAAFGVAPAQAQTDVVAHAHYAVSTTQTAAQAAFDQGLTFYYAGRDQAAVQAFAAAANVDADLSMAYWGEALALGRIDERRAATILSDAEQAAGHASHEEQVLIRALAQRYPANSKSRRVGLDSFDYRDAMEAAYKQYPDDATVGALTADAELQALNLAGAWKDGTPTPDMADALTTLAAVFRSDPDNLGAQRLCRQALEGSGTPPSALSCAVRLQSVRAGVIEAHIARTAVEVDRLTGNYAALVRDGERAHDAAAALDGALRTGDAAAIERGTQALAAAHSPLLPFVYVRTEGWDAILALPEPPANSVPAGAAYHYARALALAAKFQLDAAAKEGRAFDRVTARATGNEAKFDVVLHDVMLARFADGLGDRSTAIAQMDSAADASDALDANASPPGWAYPVREWLGGLLLDAKRYEDAEQTFRDDLEKHPRDPRDLFGLMKSLQGEDRPADAAYVQTQWREVWKGAPEALHVSAL
ncbi:MAG: hypothetical protein ACREM8_03420 [Vulcanimicrobiaceae bacterium]